MSIFRNFGYAVDSFLCRHNRVISKLGCYIGAFGCAVSVIICVTMALLLTGSFSDQMRGEEGNVFAYVFFIGWIIACLIAAAFSVYGYMQCLLASKKFGRYAY